MELSLLPPLIDRRPKHSHPPKVGTFYLPGPPRSAGAMADQLSVCGPALVLVAFSVCSSEKQAYPNLARTMVWSPRGTVVRHSPSSGCAASCAERFRAGVWDVPT